MPRVPRICEGKDNGSACSGFGELCDHCNVLKQLCGKAMALLKPRGIVPRNGHAALRVLRYKKLERQIDCRGGRSQHQGSAGGWISEYQELCGGHGHAGLLGFAAVVDEGEQSDASGLKDVFFFK